jgi:sugar lactone lactonase YvrE
MPVIELFSEGDDVIGEGPLWSVPEQALYWIDIARKQVHRSGPSDPRRQSWSLPDYPGCLAGLAPGESIAAAMGEGVHQLDLTSGGTDLICKAPPRRPGTRFNDGKVDPCGRLWVGTMQNNFGPHGESVPVDHFDGALYRIDADRRVDILETEIGIANTLAWSPDLSRFYFGDSLKGCLYLYDFDAASGTIHNKRTFYDTQGYGTPDGSAIDVDGCLWNARWDAGALLRITPQGKLDQVIQLPVPRPTSCIFGGPGLKTLYVTSATYGLTAAQLEQSPLSGSVFAIQGAGQGIPVPLMRCMTI